MKHKTLADRFWLKVNKADPAICWLWIGGLNSRGYGLLHSPPRSLQCAHRISWELHCGPIPDGMFVLHKCDMRACVNPEHLFLGNALANARDREAKGRGRVAFGTDHPRAILTPELVLAIRTEYRPGHGNVTRLAHKYGITAAHAGNIIHNKSWRHLCA